MAGIWWGVWRDDQDANGDSTVAGSPYTQSVDVETGKRPSLVIINKPWWNNGYVTFSSISSFFTTVRNHGQVPVLGWQSKSWNGTPATPLDNTTIANGGHDAFLTTFAQGVAALGYPILILFDEECNGSWESWFDSTGVSFVAMWKHVVNIFRANGATNATWIWDVNGLPPGGSFANWWPSASYVDWAVVDIFNFSYSQGAPWLTFDQIMASDTTGTWGDSFDALTALDTTGKVQYGVGSFSSDDRNPNGTNNFTGQATWITDAFGTQLPRASGSSRDYSKIQLVLWFDQNEPHPSLSDGQDHRNITGYPLGSDTQSQAAFQGPNGPGGGTYYVAGGQFILPSGMQKLPPYSGTAQDSFFTRGVLQTAPNNLVGLWKFNETSGTAAADSSGNSRSGTYTGTPNTNYTLGKPRLITSTYDKCVQFDGVAGYCTIPNNAAFSLPTTGSLTLMVVFNMVALPTGTNYVALCGFGGNGGNTYQWAMRVRGDGIFEGDVWNLAGGTYSTAGSPGSTIVAGKTYIGFWSMNQSASPISTLGLALLGATAVSTYTSSDTPANAPVSNAAQTLDFGRRPDNTEFANVQISYGALWNIALNTVSMRELMKYTTFRATGSQLMSVG